MFFDEIPRRTKISEDYFWNDFGHVVQRWRVSEYLETLEALAVACLPTETEVLGLIPGDSLIWRLPCCLIYFLSFFSLLLAQLPCVSFSWTSCTRVQKSLFNIEVISLHLNKILRYKKSLFSLFSLCIGAKLSERNRCSASPEEVEKILRKL